MTKRPPTYDALKQELEHRAPKTISRDRSALHFWQHVQAADFDDRVESLLVDSETFENAIRCEVDAWARREGKQRRQKNQRMTGLRAVRRIALDLGDLSTNIEPTTLADAVKRCRRELGITKRQIRLRYGACVNTWELGRSSLPLALKEPTLRRIAQEAGFDDDFLIRFARRSAPVRRTSRGPRNPAYGLSTAGLKLPGSPSARADLEEIEGPLKRELQAFVDYKTSPNAAGLNRPPGSAWTTNRGGRTATFKQNIKLFESFFGWLHTVEGIPIERMSLLMIADAVLVEKFSDFCRKRSAPSPPKILAQAGHSLLIDKHKKYPNYGTIGFIRQQMRVYFHALTDDSYQRRPRLTHCGLGIPLAEGV